MALIGHSLVNATTLGAGTSIFFDVPKRFISMQINANGTTAQWDVQLEVTLDRVTWVSIANIQVTTNGSTLVGSETGPVIGVRANLVEVTDGTFNAFVAGA